MKSYDYPNPTIRKERNRYATIEIDHRTVWKSTIMYWSHLQKSPNNLYQCLHCHYTAFLTADREPYN